MVKRLLVKLGMSVVMLTSALSCTTITARADSLMERIYTDEETEENFSEAYNTPLARGSYLSYGYASITKESNDEVLLYASTQAYVTCDLIGLSMALERKVNGSYGTYKTWDYYEENSFEMSKGLYVLVPKESFYRLRTYHSAKVGVTKESTSCLTKGIYIGDNY